MRQKNLGCDAHFRKKNGYRADYADRERNRYPATKKHIVIMHNHDIIKAVRYSPQRVLNADLVFGITLLGFASFISLLTNWKMQETM